MLRGETVSTEQGSDQHNDQPCFGKGPNYSLSPTLLLAPDPLTSFTIYPQIIAIFFCLYRLTKS